MKTLAITLFAIGGLVFLWNLGVYVVNTRPRNADQMGSAINFHFGNFFAGALIAGGLIFHPGISAWWSLAAIGIGWLGSIFILMVFDNLLGMIRSSQKHNGEHGVDPNAWPAASRKSHEYSALNP